MCFFGGIFKEGGVGKALPGAQAGSIMTLLLATPAAGVVAARPKKPDQIVPLARLFRRSFLLPRLVH
jgi:hypothetical protein